MGEVFSLNNILVLLALGGACYSDLRQRRVDNRFVISVFVLGIVLQLFNFGFSGFWPLLSSLAAAVILGLPLYLMKVFGGGDFKLLVAVSTLLHWQAVIVILAASFVWGALLGVSRMLLEKQSKNVLHNIGGIFLKTKVPASQLHMIPFTIALFFGFLSQLTLSHIGWELL